ncbi:MAG: DMT family transporter [Rhodospirillales bacterium]|nr:DMT family transporter [Rhodospirillales bacterium]
MIDISDTAGQRLKMGHAYILLALAVLTWAIGLIIGRAVYEEIPPVGLSFWRWQIAALILLPFCWQAVWRDIHVVRENLMYFFWQGAFMTGGGVLLFLALNYTTAINVSLVNATQPALTVLIARLIARDKVNGIQLSGIAAAMVGVAIMVTKADKGVLLALEFNMGDLITILATMSYAMYAVNIRKMPTGLGLFPSVFVILVLGSIFLLPIYIWETLYIRPVPFTGTFVMSAITLAILVSILALAMWNTGNAIVGHNRASIFVNLFPIYSAILAITFLNESVFIYHVFGAVFVCAGICMVVRK